ncbi:hypothetical protein C8R45DRAFT_1006347, partial [Mycena sanguinolenta]
MSGYVLCTSSIGERRWRRRRWRGARAGACVPRRICHARWDPESLRWVLTFASFLSTIASFFSVSLPATQRQMCTSADERLGGRFSTECALLMVSPPDTTVYLLPCSSHLLFCPLHYWTDIVPRHVLLFTQLSWFFAGPHYYIQLDIPAFLVPHAVSTYNLNVVSTYILQISYHKQLFPLTECTSREAFSLQRFAL